MTLQDIRFQLIRHFCDKDSFGRNDFEAIKVDGQFEEAKDSLIIAALGELEKMGLIREVSINSFWMLSNPIESMVQQLTLSMPVCLLIADTIENFFKANGIDHDKVNPFDINQTHVLTVVQILDDMLDSNTEKKKSQS